MARGNWLRWLLERLRLRRRENLEIEYKKSREEKKREEKYEQVIADVVVSSQHDYWKPVEVIHKYIDEYIHGQCSKI